MVQDVGQCTVLVHRKSSVELILMCLSSARSIISPELPPSLLELTPAQVKAIIIIIITPSYQGGRQ